MKKIDDKYIADKLKSNAWHKDEDGFITFYWYDLMKVIRKLLKKNEKQIT